MPERTVVVRPPMLTDWYGRKLDKQIKSQIRVGNHVRVLFETLDRQGWNTVYLKIIKQCKKDKSWFVGIVDDPYYDSDPFFMFRNGTKRAFSIHHVIELPLEWKDNYNLKKNAKYLM